MKISVSFSIPILILILLSGCGQRPQKNEQQAPDFTLSLFEQHDHKVTLSEVAKEHPVLLIFWATWCPSCVSEVSTLNAWYDKYRERGLEILGVNVQESPEQISEFTKKTPIRYPSLVDEDGEVASRYGLVGVPAAVFLAKGGKIIYYGFGLPDNVDQLLAQS